MKSLRFSFWSFADYLLLLAMLLISSLTSAQSVIRFEPSKPAGGREGEYRSHFKAYSMGSINTAQVATLLESNNHFDTLSIEASGNSYSFSLEAHDVRAEGFKVWILTGQGKEELPSFSNVTYAGKTLKGGYNVRITSHPEYFTAMIDLGHDELYIEPARLIDSSAAENQFVIFKSGDVINLHAGSTCGATIPKLESPPDQERSERMLPCRVMELAIANDYLMSNMHGGSLKVALFDIAVLNLVDKNYETSFGSEIFHKVTEIMVPQSAAADPFYTGTDYYQLLNSFTGWAPTGFTLPHDVGSMWTARDLDGGVVGLAWVDRMCEDSAYNILQDFTVHMGQLRCLQAHELGHNYGYGHDPDGGWIMSASVEDPPANIWSPASIIALMPKFDNANCMTNCANTGGRVGIGTVTPHPSAALDVSSSTQGMLVPRMSPIQRSNISQPAEGLLVYDTNSKSFWFNSVNKWIEIMNTNNSTVHVDENQDSYFGMNGNVGIGTMTPEYKLDVNGSLRASGTSFFPSGIGIGAGSPAQMLSVSGGAYISGNVGLGISNPNAPLTFTPTSANRKIMFRQVVNNEHQFYGFGYNTGLLRFQVGETSGDYAFFAATSASTSNELMRIRGTGIVGIGTSSPNASAILDLTSTSKGVLIPRMTTTERNAIASPATGLLVFDITTNSFWFRGTSAWIELNDNLDTEVFRNGTDKIYMGLTDSVGIGTMNPAYKLDVRTANNQYGLAQTDGTIQLATWLGDGGEIGTVTNHPFRLYANNGLHQFELLPNGKIGIGLSNPLNRFDINNGAANRTGTHGTGMAMYVTGDFGPASNGVEFRNNDATQGIGFGSNTIYAAGSNANQDFNLTAKGTSGNIIFNTNNTERVRITGTGNVGIGTLAPNEKLEIANNGRAFFGDGGGAIRKGLLIDGVETNGARIEAYDYGAGSGMDLLLNSLGGNVGIGISNSNAPLQFASTAANRKIVLYEAGNNDHQFIGFGVDGSGALRYQTASTVNDHVFYVATSATASNELMRIRGSGNVSIAGIIETEAVAVPTLLNGFTQFGGGFAAVSYYKDKEGIVHVRGMANVPANPVGLIIFNLPIGYRPSTSGAHVFMTIGNNVATRVDVLINGDVIFNSGTTGWVSLDTITFRAD